jgi:hypothetical protein
MGWNDGPECQRCYRMTERCEVCKGKGEIWGPIGNSSCTECDGTGWVCPQDGKYWKR